MKLIVVFLMLVLAESAHGAVKSPGAFVPNRCGLQTYIDMENAKARVREICLGRMDGEADHTAYQFRFSDGALRFFHVIRTEPTYEKMSFGTMKTVLHLVGERGEHLTMKAFEDFHGQIESLSGVIEGQPFLVPQLDDVLPSEFQ